jgi:hypothetical protein
MTARHPHIREAVEQLSEIEARCTPGASAYLHDLQSHPSFPALVNNLARIDGRIERIDVFLELVQTLQ